MEMRQPQQLRAQQTRRVLVEGAARAFNGAGYSVASLADVSRASGLSQGALYFHFKSKRQLALGVIEEQHRRTYGMVAEAVEEEADALEQMIVISRRLVGQLLTDDVVRAGFRLTTDETALRETTAEFYEQWAHGTAVLVERAVASGMVESTLSARRLGRLLVGFFVGTEQMAHATTENTDLVAAVGAMWAPVIDGVVAVHWRQHAKDLVFREFGATD